MRISNSPQTFYPGDRIAHQPRVGSEPPCLQLEKVLYMDISERRVVSLAKNSQSL